MEVEKGEGGKMKKQNETEAKAVAGEEAMTQELYGTMKEQLTQLKEIRQKQKELQIKWQFLKDQLAIENKDLLEDIGGYTEDIDVLEPLIKTAALAKYKKTGEKKFDFGVGIQEGNEIKYDIVKAKAWAEKTGIGLKLDNSAFESFAKSQKKDLKSVNLEFVEFHNRTIATIRE